MKKNKKRKKNINNAKVSVSPLGHKYTSTGLLYPRDAWSVPLKDKKKMLEHYFS